MVVAGDFKNGITFDMDGQVMQVIEFQEKVRLLFVQSCVM